MVVHTDPRKAFVVDTIAGAIAPAEQKEAYADYLAKDDSGAIAAFLDDGGVRMLQAAVAKAANGQVQILITKLQPGPVPAGDMMSSICVSSVANSPLSSLYHSLSDVYYPLLGIGPDQTSFPPHSAQLPPSSTQQQLLDPRLQELLLQVQAGLGNAVKQGAPAKAGSVSQGQQDLASAPLQDIIQPLDELDYWAQLATLPGPQARIAQQVNLQLDALRQPLTDLAHCTLEGSWEEARELVGRIGDVLRAVWSVADGGRGWAVGQRRMGHFMRVLGAAFSLYVQSKLRGTNVFTAPFAALKGPLTGASQVLAAWAAEARSLSQDWACGVDGGGHKWEGPLFGDGYVDAFRERLDQIYGMRETHEELSRLLGPQEANALALDQVFVPFAAVAPLRVSDFTAAAWRSAADEYERRMGPIEQRICEKLKELFASVFVPNLTAAVARQQCGGSSTAAAGSSATSSSAPLPQPSQVFSELRRYGGLLQRPAVDAALQPEKQALAKQIDRYLENVQQEFDSQRDAARADGKGGSRAMSGAVDRISWVLQAQGRVSHVTDTLTMLLGARATSSSTTSSNATSSSANGTADSDHSNAAPTAAGAAGPAAAALRSCLGVAGELSKELELHKKELFSDWQGATQQALTAMAAWKDSQLMTFDAKNAHVRTHFSESLVVLLRQVRQLQALGFSVRTEILAEVDTANKFYRYGMALKQCANFYNNIATEMIHSQKPMMLADALEFEKVLMSPRDAQGREITWRNAAALDGYVRRLSEVSERLAEKNRTLRQWHSVLADKVLGLMNTDLVRHKDRWAAGVKDMRDVFARLEGQGYGRDAQRVWRQHWDFQLYKALQFQYCQGLECINQNLPEIEIKLVFRQRQLQYDPPLEELRARHTRDHINAFLGLPLKMKGVSDLSERAGFFRAIADASPAAIARVYNDAEGLFARLADELKKYQDWVVLGGVDLEDYVDANLVEVSDWELNLRMLKAAARDAERLPNEVRVDCYRVSLLPLKASVDDLMKRLREALGASLRRKAVGEMQQIESFISAGQQLLGLQATSVEEIGRAGAEAKQLVNNMGTVTELRKRIEEKNRLLRAMAAAGASGVAPVDLSGVTEQWDGFTSSLQQYDAHLEQQRAQLQAGILRQAEDFKGTVAGFASRWQALKPKGGPGGNPAVVLAQLQDCVRQLEELKEEANKFAQECELLKVESPDFSQLEEVGADVAATQAAWARYGDFMRERDDMANKDWLSMRDQVWKIEDFLTKWEKAIMPAADASSQQQRDASTDAIAAILLHEVDAYRRCLPHLRAAVRGSGWEDTHWNTLFALLGLKVSGPGAVTKETVTLSHFLSKADALIANAEKIRALDAQAQGEAVLRKALSELKLWGLQREFTFADAPAGANTASATKSSTGGAADGAARGSAGGKGGSGQQQQRGVVLIKEWREVLSEVGDHQSLVASLKQSAFYHLFKDEVASWESKLGFLTEGLALLNQVQRKWVYLAPIFARGALPQQQARFRNVDAEFRSIMGQIAVGRKVVSFAELPGIRDRLPAMASQLDMCQKALAEFLEEKRSAFPRFYFLGDDDLLEVLGQAKDPLVIQTHLKKLFAGIHKVKFSPDATSITAMVSMEGEVVELQPPVAVTEAIEVWLAALVAAMRSTLSTLVAGVGRMAEPFAAAPSQVLQLFHAIRFTERAEKAIQSRSLASLASEYRSELAALSAADYTGHTLLQLKKQALVLDLLHYCEVAEELAAASPGSTSEWAWTRQLRYYAAKDGKVTVHMAEGAFDYSWEYQGNAPKLVYTSLTDKCYLTLTQAMALGYGGNPYGPAGTGKTESVKALGQAMGRQVLVFNCDEKFDFRAMGRIFVGLVQCGAWGCFDEFNRLDEEVLSAVSQQIQTIQVDKNAGIFVTLNPAGKGYGGRSKLPDNLKQLFRPIAMTVPDNDQIAEVLLTSEGFSAAKTLSRKLVALFSLSRELLSRQQHYDWGLRALKTALGVAGRQLREVRKVRDQVPTAQQEAEIIVRAVCATKLPTLTFDDNGRFRGLLGDLFPGVSITDARNAELEGAIAEVATAHKLELTQQQVEKMLQLHLACEQRIGVILVGPSGAGKSTLWQLLEGAYERLGRKPMVHRLNPKAMPRQQLLGCLNLDTREWADGVLTAAARRVVLEPLEQRSWIVCDGDVDPEWIESLNSVLDDNRLLTLPNGERIQFANNVNFIFECHSLQFASPATVSRCGMLFMSDEALDAERVLHKWLAEHPEADPSGNMAAWLKDLFPRALSMALSRPRAVETTRTGLLDSALSHLALGAATKHDFAAALARGLGANMQPGVRDEFVAELGRFTGEADLLHVSPAEDPTSCLDDPDFLESILGAGGALLGAGGAGGPGGGGLLGGAPELVMTADARETLALLAPWLRNQEPFLLVGPEGCGKSTLLAHCFSRLRGASVAVLHCSAQTTAAQVLQKLTQVCGKPVTTTSGRCLRPDTGRVILYLKDINLPRPDKYDTIQLIALLQQLLTHGGYYNADLEFINLERVQVIGSMAPGAVGRSSLSSRFTARVRLAAMGYPDKEQLQEVYCNMLATEFGGGHDRTWAPIAANAQNLARAMLELYHQLLGSFPVTEQRHYQWTPRDLTAWVRALKRYDLQGMELGEAVAHEACRIFRDRLVDEPSCAKFDELLGGVLRSALGYKGPVSTTLCSTLGATTEDRLASESPVTSASPPRLRLARWSPGDLSGLVSTHLKSFERERKDLGLLLFPEFLGRLAALDRALAAPGGSVLLVGPSGAGRRSAAQLVAHAHVLEFVTPKVTKQYSDKAFRCELREAMRAAGVEGRRLLLYIEDHQVGDPGVLEAVNSLLSGGEVPGLWSADELAKELAPLEAARAADAAYQGPPSLYAYFTSRIQRNLHVAVALNPAHEDFRARCEANPALLNACSLQWWRGWSDEGLARIPLARLKDLLALCRRSDDGEADPANVLAGQLVALHRSASAQPLCAAPRHFLSLVELFGAILARKRAQLLEQRSFLKGGLDKLQEAATTVDTLSRQAHSQRTLLVQKQSEADEAMVSIQASMGQAAERRREVEVLRGKLHEDEAVLQDQRGGVEVQLAEVQPLIDAARAAVSGIKSEHLSEIRSLRMAPDAIRDVLEGVLCLMGIEDVSWTNMKGFLGKRSVKEDIMNFNPAKITAAVRRKVEKLLEAKGQSFEKEVIYRASQAAGPMAGWVKANLEYSRVYEKVAPLQNKLDAVVSGLKESQERLAQCEEELQLLDAKVAQLTADFQLRIREAEALKFQLERAETTLNAATDLLSKLSGERERWGRQLAGLGDELDVLPLAALVSAGFVVHLTAQPEDVRARLMAEWTKTFGLAPTFDVCRFMSSESEMLCWKGQGLPADALSCQNAMAILHAKQPPLIIDPSSQAIEWLQAYMKANNTPLDIAPIHDARFANTLELAVRFGKALVVSEVDRIEPLLYPLLRRDLERQGPRMVVALGDKLVDYHENFRLFLVTRNAAPLLPPDAQPLLTITNFTITRSGMEGQLLNLTLACEQPELEAQRSGLLQQEEGLRVQLAALEKQLLQTLATSKGNLLENAELLQSLNDAKSKSATIAASLKEGAALQASLEVQRGAYRPLAARGSLLFFLLGDLAALNSMYRFSLASFLALFRRALASGRSSSGAAGSSGRGGEGAVAARIGVLADALLELVFSSVSRSLFNADRLIFALHLARHLNPAAFPPHEWDFLLSRISATSATDGAMSATDSATSATASGNSAARRSAGSKPAWVRPEAAPGFSALQAVLPELVQSAELHDSGIWAAWGGSGEDGLPSRVAGRLSSLQGLLLVKALKPDRLHSAMARVACSLLNLRALSPPSASIRQLVDTEATSTTPLLLITTPGADPCVELSEHAAATVGRARYKEVAMGQGQAELALQALKEAARDGTWLVLRNLHLAVSWLPVLEKEVYGLATAAAAAEPAGAAGVAGGGGPHPDFRLFLTSEPHSRFPAALLESTLKVTFEAPPGIKKNLQRTYEAWPPEFIAQGGPLRAQLLFLLAWFHAIVQERRSYIPLGWSKVYEFSTADLRSGCDVVALAVKGAVAGQPQWAELHGLLEKAIYGGRVDNLCDARVLRAYLLQTFSPAILGLPGTRPRSLPGLRAALPTSAHRQDYTALIEALPDADPPALFGLPENIDRAAQQANSGAVLAQLKQMSIAKDASAGFNRDRWAAQLSPLLKQWDTLMASAPPSLRQAARAAATATAATATTTGAGPAVQDQRGGGASSSSGGSGSSSSPVDAFVVLERAHGVALVGLIDRALAALGGVLRGSNALTSAVQATGAALMTDTVPSDWDRHWEGPESPADYCRAAVARASALETWLNRSQGGQLLSGSSPLLLCQLFNPGTLLNALRQQSARLLGRPIDELRLATTWDARQLPSGCPLAVQLGGLLIQGAAFDGARLTAAAQDAPTSACIPPMHLAWLPKDTPLPYHTHMSAPLYLCSDRAKALADVQLPIGNADEAEQWTLSGVALLLEP